MNALIQLRQDLHQHPELSGLETQTAQRILKFFEKLNPDRTVTDLGGTGLAFCFGDGALGPTVLLRCELDALPISEWNTFSYRSARDSTAHKCGHDGHMAILAAVGQSLSKKRLRRGRVVLLYQPAEETGDGAAAVVADPKFAEIKPDYSFALHNLPGFPLGKVLVRTGTFACASRGMITQFHGRTGHAAQPETGTSPSRAMCEAIRHLNAIPAAFESGDELAFATVVGANLGEKSFGIAPGRAEVFATLRTETDATMEGLAAHCESLVQELAEADRLQVEVAYEEIFPATMNSKSAVATILAAVAHEQTEIIDKPFRWSEDFGRFTALSEGAMFGLGAGEQRPDLHNPDYDFPDDLIEVGSEVFLRIVNECLS